MREAVNCVFAQSYRQVELIVVDDGSIDESWSILQELAQKYYGKIHVLQQQNQGPYPARNRALSQASGEFLMFLDADDYWSNDCVEKLHTRLVGSDSDLVYCGWQNVGIGGPGSKPYIPPEYEVMDIIEAFLKACPWPIHAVMVRRNLLEKLDGFSTRFHSSMDYDLWIRVPIVTRKIARVPEVLAFYRWHSSSQISAVKWKQVLESWQVRLDFIRENHSLVNHIPASRLNELTHGFILRSAYNAYWKRDIYSAQKLFRKILRLGYFRAGDMKYILLSLLPGSILRFLLRGQVTPKAN